MLWAGKAIELTLQIESCENFISQKKSNVIYCIKAEIKSFIFAKNA